MKDQTFLTHDKYSIHLTTERLNHIIINHPEMIEHIFEFKEVISFPDYIVEGKNNERIALRQYTDYYHVIIYKVDTKTKDGFIITSFTTTNVKYYLKKKIIWKKK